MVWHAPADLLLPNGHHIHHKHVHLSLQWGGSILWCLTPWGSRTCCFLLMDPMHFSGPAWLYFSINSKALGILDLKMVKSLQSMGRGSPDTSHGWFTWLFRVPLDPLVIASTTNMARSVISGDELPFHFTDLISISWGTACCIDVYYDSSSIF